MKAGVVTPNACGVYLPDGGHQKDTMLQRFSIYLCKVIQLFWHLLKHN